jgi:acylphosphatase
MPKRIIIKGDVQGVGFRWFAQKYANEFGVSGYARNLDNGSLEIVAFGQKFELFLEHLKKGPHYASIKEITVENCKEKVLPGFRIR